MFGHLLGSRGSRARLQALDALGANIMLADLDLNITYLNHAMRALLREFEADLRKDLPRFSMTTLVGANIDIFHKTPSCQRPMLATLETRHNAVITVGKLVFDLLVTPLLKGRRRIGFVLEWTNAALRLRNLDDAAQIAAITLSQAVIEFAVDGTIVDANRNFLDAMGYGLADAKGKHHRLFCERTYSDSPDYARFWEKLGRGESITAEFKRIHKNGSVVTIQGSYNPILDANGKVMKVVKFATDVTKRVDAVTEIGDALAALASGNLEQRIEHSFIPELDKLRIDLNLAMNTLQVAMQNVGQAAAAIKTGTDEIAAASNDLSKRTEHQAASLEQTAAALDQITATVRKTADGAAHAQTIVSAAMMDAETSGEIVAKAVTAMGQIETSAEEIGNIIGVIDEIAFQTNLLALNAGVEAARAGDAGRGFAVVASEVRALAQRSAEAAKEIKTLISTSSKQVAAGVGLVGDTGKALGRIVLRIAEVNGVVAQIAASAQEQATGLHQVNTAVNQMDQATQQNAAMVEESTGASQALAQEAEQLSRMMTQFQVGHHQPFPVRPARRPVAHAGKPAVVARARHIASAGRSKGGAATALAGDAWEEF